MYAEQGKYWNDPTANIPANQIITMLGDMVQTAGILYVSHSSPVPNINVIYNNRDSASFQAGLRDYDLNVATRASWKYGCSRMSPLMANDR
jgi:hypothetical protein